MDYALVPNSYHQPICWVILLTFNKFLLHPTYLKKKKNSTLPFFTSSSFLPFFSFLRIAYGLIILKALFIFNFWCVRWSPPSPPRSWCWYFLWCVFAICGSFLVSPLTVPCRPSRVSSHPPL